MADLPAALLRSITWDQGAEMAPHLTIAQSLGAPVYFCDSRSPCQRGSNENTVSLVVAPLGWSGRLVPAA
jgi:IS30 family transposase